MRRGWSDWLLYRREVEEEEDVVTATAETQTDIISSEGESFEMTELREEVISTVLLHPAPTPSPARKPPPPPQPSTSRAADAGPPASSSAAALTVTAQPHQLQRLTTEEIAARLHSRGTGSRNVQPG